MSRDRKKHEKQKKRERKNTEQKRYAQRKELERHRRDQYPKFVIDRTNGDSEFVNLVRTALKEIDFDDPKMFDETERLFYRLMRQHGTDYAMSAYRKALQAVKLDGDPTGRLREILMRLAFGTLLLERIPEESRRRLMPYNDVFVDLRGQQISLEFSSLLTERGTDGTIFYSRRKPKVEFNGKEWTAAFSRHAIERICERVNPRYIEYRAAGDIHALFAQCVYFEPIQLHENQPAFVFYDICSVPGFVSYSTYVKGVLGEEQIDPSKGEIYYRLGYCPVVFEKEFAKAKTFLHPGFKKTPEYGLVLKARLNQTEKEMLINHAATQDSEAIKWFHNNGMAQVVQMTRKVFVRGCE